jgi:acetyltransferase-like isoleucine patch superfamily enzyme
VIKKTKQRQLLIDKGILVVGKNSNINALEIVLPYSIKANSSYTPQVIIGDDCIVNGRIVLYSTAAKVEIGNRVYIGPDTEFFCYDKIVLGDDILFSWGITIIDTNAHSINFEQRKNDVLNWQKGKKDWDNIVSTPVHIKSKTWIGFNSIITKGITINEEAIVSCGSVVVKDVAAKTIVGGNPAQFIKNITDEEKK